MALLRLNPLRSDHLRGDVYGGVTAAIIALPLALAFGVASGAGPVAGLYGAICVGLLAALFGGTPSQISGPTGPMTIVAAAVFTQYAQQPAVAFTVVMMAGLFQILFGALRLGRYVNLLPYPVISGFMTGIGCILIIMQLDPLLGHPTPPTVLNALSVLPAYLRDPNWHAVTVGVTAFCIASFTPKWIGRRVPPTLLALITAIALAFVLPAAPTLAGVEGALPRMQMPAIDLATLTHMLTSAAVLAALGSIDSLLTSVVADNVTRRFHDSDKELVGQGLGNLAAGFFGGLPGAGATIRTLANVSAGGVTAWSGTIHALVLLAIAIGLGPLVGYIPEAALAGVLLKVGVDVMDWRYLKRMHRAPRVDLVCMMVVLVLTVFLDVVTAVATGVILSSLLFVKEMAELQMQSIRTISSPQQGGPLAPREAALFERCAGRVVMLHLSGLISFGAANDMTRRMAMVTRTDVLIIDLLDVPKMDGSAALAVEEIVQRALDAGQDVIVVGLRYPVARLFSQLGILELVKETRRFATRFEAIEAAIRILAERDATGAGAERPAPARA